jgi:hypothetical protein
MQEIQRIADTLGSSLGHSAVTAIFVEHAVDLKGIVFDVIENYVILVNGGSCFKINVNIRDISHSNHLKIIIPRLEKKVNSG